MSDFFYTPPTSVALIPGTNKSAAFTPKTSEVFKGEHNIAPVIIYANWRNTFSLGDVCGSRSC